MTKENPTKLIAIRLPVSLLEKIDSCGKKIFKTMSKEEKLLCLYKGKMNRSSAIEYLLTKQLKKK